MEISDVRIAQPPEICELCSSSLRDRVIDTDDKTTQILFYCPHHFTIIHCTMGTVEGQRSVTKWIFEGPVSEDQYIDTATKLGELHGAQMDVHHTGSLQ